MGIYLPNMEMPTSCNACMFDVYGLCLINENIEGEDELTHSCPLVPVPPHGDLIDRDALPFEMCEYADGSPVWLIEKREVDNAPTIISDDPPVMYYPQVPGITPTVIAEEGET